jgi:ketosteroid isomerase-like protein
MSQSVEIVREQIQAWNRRADGWVEFFDSDAEFHMPPEWPEDPVYRGHDGITRVDVLLAEGFNEFHWDIDRLIDAGDCVVGLYHARGRIKEGGTWLEQPIGAVSFLRDGKIVRMRSYLTWSEALEAAGVQGSGTVPGA